MAEGRVGRWRVYPDVHEPGIWCVDGGTNATEIRVREVTWDGPSATGQNLNADNQQEPKYWLEVQGELLLDGMAARIRVPQSQPQGGRSGGKQWATVMQAYGAALQFRRVLVVSGEGAVAMVRVQHKDPTPIIRVDDFPLDWLPEDLRNGQLDKQSDQAPRSTSPGPGSGDGPDDTSQKDGGGQGREVRQEDGGQGQIRQGTGWVPPRKLDERQATIEPCPYTTDRRHMWNSQGDPDGWVHCLLCNLLKRRSDVGID